MKLLKTLKKIKDMCKEWGIIFVFRLKIISKIKGENYKNKIILQYLECKYNYIVEHYQICNNKQDTPIDEKCPIYVCWLQGEEAMPDIVKLCYDSIKKNSGNHEVILLTLNNYGNYVSIPDYIIDKFNRGTISFAHFSDILRVALISSFGGIWLDSTIFLTKNIQTENLALFTLKQKCPTNKSYVSKFMWTSYALGGGINNTLFCFLRDFLFEYYLNEDYLLDYFLFDYIISIGYRNISEIKRMIDEIPYSNEKIYYFTTGDYDVCDNERFNSIINDTTVFKLSYKLNDESYKEAVKRYLKPILEKNSENK